MITNNFGPLLNAMLTHHPDGYDGTPALEWSVVLFPNWITLSPSSFEKKALQVLKEHWDKLGLAPNREMFYGILGAVLEPSEGQDLTEFSSKVQMGMLQRYPFTEAPKICDAYEEGRNFHIFMDAQTKAAEIYSFGAKVNGEKKQGWEEAFKYQQQVMATLQSSSGQHDTRQSKESPDVSIGIIEAARESRTYNPPLKTGLTIMDIASGGFDPGDMVSILGCTGQGKSMIAMTMVYNFILTGNTGVYITLEMTTALCMARFYSMHSAHPKFRDIHPPLPDAKAIKNGHLTEAQAIFLFTQVIPDFACLPGQVIVEKPVGFFGYQELEATLKRLQHTNRDTLRFFIVDHPGLMDITPERGLSESNMRDKMYSRIMRTAQTFNGVGLTAILPVQANEVGRARAEKDPNHRLDLGAIGHSAEISRSSSLIYFVSSFPLMYEQSIAMIGCLKDRNGCYPRDFTVDVKNSRVMDVPPPTVTKPGSPMPTFAL